MEMYDGAKYYHDIPGLMIPKSNSVHEQVDSDINYFIDNMPALIDEIEYSLKYMDADKQNITLAKNVSMLRTLLNNVYARGLEANAMKLLRLLQDGSPIKKIEEMMRPFMKDLMSLSVAMQKAQSPEEADNIIEVSEIEIQANADRNLTAIMSLIDDSEFDTAMRITSDLMGHFPGDAGLEELMDLIRSKQYIKAKNHILKLRGQYSKTINKLAGVDFSKTVLAVDDMPPILLFVNDALKKHYKVMAMTSGKTALEALETQTPDLFLFDIEMPEMDGFTLAKIIRDNAIYAHIPIIFLTGNTAREYVATAMSIENSELIVKPLSHDQLLTAVGKYLHPR